MPHCFATDCTPENARGAPIRSTAAAKPQRRTDRRISGAVRSRKIRRRDAYYEDRESFGPERQSIFDEAALRGLAQSWSNNVGWAIDFGPRSFTDHYFEVKYEDLLEAPAPLFEDMVRFLGADADGRIIEACVNQNTFEKSSGNRVRGEEDPSSFFRKGIAGDWKNYFTERDKDIFKEEAGDLLIRLGYEEDYDW